MTTTSRYPGVLGSAIYIGQGDQLIFPESPEVPSKTPADPGWLRLTNLLRSISPLTSLASLLCLTSTFPLFLITTSVSPIARSRRVPDPAIIKSVSPPLSNTLIAPRQTSHPNQPTFIIRNSKRKPSEVLLQPDCEPTKGSLSKTTSYSVLLPRAWRIRRGTG